MATTKQGGEGRKEFRLWCPWATCDTATKTMLGATLGRTAIQRRRYVAKDVPPSMCSPSHHALHVAIRVVHNTLLECFC